MTEQDYILLNEMIDNCKNAQGYDDPKREQKYQMLNKVLSIVEKEGKWDTNKDTRNSRQRIANYQVLKQLQQVSEDLGLLKHYTRHLLTELQNASLIQNSTTRLHDFEAVYNRSTNTDWYKDELNLIGFTKMEEII